MKGGWGEREKEEEHGVAKAMEKAALLQDTAALGLPFLSVQTAGAWRHPCRCAWPHRPQQVHLPWPQGHFYFVLFTAQDRFFKF